MFRARREGCTGCTLAQKQLDEVLSLLAKVTLDLHQHRTVRNELERKVREGEKVVALSSQRVVELEGEVRHWKEQMQATELLLLAVQPEEG